MQLEQAFELPFARDAVWAAFHDIPMLVSCLPGATLVSAPDADPLQFTFAVKLGPISANFAGQGSVTYNDDCSGALSGSGADRATSSRVKGYAKFTLEEIPTGTRVQLIVDFALSGALAQFGRSGIVKELAANITQRFAENLRARLQTRAGGVAPAVTSANAAPEPAPSAPLDGGSLLWSVLWGRIKQFFGSRS